MARAEHAEAVSFTVCLSTCCARSWPCLCITVWTGRLPQCALIQRSPLPLRSVALPLWTRSGAVRGLYPPAPCWHYPSPLHLHLAWLHPGVLVQKGPTHPRPHHGLHAAAPSASQATAASSVTRP